MPRTIVGTSVLDSSLFFPSGTRLLFQQLTPPTGWTKDTSAAANEAILRLNNTNTPAQFGYGGSTAFSAFNGQTATGAYTLTSTDLPAHTHTASGSVSIPYASNGSIPAGSQTYLNTTSGTMTSPTFNITTGSTGGLSLIHI